MHGPDGHNDRKISKCGVCTVDTLWSLMCSFCVNRTCESALSQTVMKRNALKRSCLLHERRLEHSLTANGTSGRNDEKM